MDSAQLEELKKATRNYDYVRFTWTDLYGLARGQTVTGRNVPYFLEYGIRCYSACVALGPRSELPNFKEVKDLKQGNMVALPEPGTFSHIPWAGHGKYKVGEVLCETHWIESNTYQEACPRTVARRQIQKLSDLGYTLKSTFEMEFKVHDLKTGTPMFDGVDVFNHLLVAENEEFLFDIEQKLMMLGINVEKIQTEYSPGQFEMSIAPLPGITAGDAFFRFKQGVKEMAQQRGLHANFMSKPGTDGCGSAAHFNHSVWCKTSGDNAMYDPAKEDNLSDLARHWVAGLIKHTNALTALCSPTVNCYRRLHGLLVPDTASWDIDDRIATFRVINYSKSATYVENRLATGLCNPYLVIAGCIAAGIDGIVNHLECPSRGQGNAPKVPFTLDEALEALESDTVMVEALGKQFVEWYCGTKRQVDIRKLQGSDMKKADPETIKKDIEIYGMYI